MNKKVILCIVMISIGVLIIVGVEALIGNPWFRLQEFKPNDYMIEGCKTDCSYILADYMYVADEVTCYCDQGGVQVNPWKYHGTSYAAILAWNSQLREIGKERLQKKERG